MALSKKEHADRIKRTLAGVHKALDLHHAALAAAAAEHGDEIGIDAETMSLAAAPKNPPTNLE